MPVVTGLYTILIPMALFALLGLQALVIGADSATAAIVAAGLVGMATIASPQYVALAGLLAILTGVIVLLARIIKLGFLADFLSRTVLIGFLTASASRSPSARFRACSGSPAAEMGRSRSSWPTFSNCPKQILSCWRFRSYYRRSSRYEADHWKIPGAQIAVIGMIILSWALDLQAKGVAVLGPVPGGLPHIGLPQVSLSVVPQLLGIAFSMFIVIIAQSAATSRAYAAKYDEVSARTRISSA